ncbi:MAG: M28 family metallopeptidase [Acidobacteriota bacterium]|nr:M28 family metallopeptidase [Acidobacteriota bacterium]
MRVAIFVTIFAVLAVNALGVDPESSKLDGYPAVASGAERTWEGKFRALPSVDKQREYMQRLSSRPHHVGSPYGKDNAEWILAKFKEWGFEAHIEQFDVLFPTPKDNHLEMIEPRKFVAKLSEPPLAIDPTTSQKGEQLPVYNAYSIDGDVTGPLVYVNYGMPSDYEELARYGVSVKGAIVIARYGGGWRGVKPKVAAEHGAIGCIIYSDPHEDGFAHGDVFPRGPFRPSDGVQRGSVMDTEYPGDPLTPGIAAVPGAKRLSIKEAQTITKIPVLPISYGDAQPLLTELRGRVVPPNWRGSLAVTYRLGPGPAKVHLKVESNWEQKPLYDVIAKLPGVELPDQWVIRGNHHDAWVNGAEDPISGLVTELEEARAFGELAKQGWKPKRTIIYCAWDGEEPGLLGSTEWVEAHGDELLKYGVAYFNSDSNARGYFGADGSHVLQKFINDVAREVPDPEKKMSVLERARLREVGEAKGSEAREEALKRTDLKIGALGDGSDYTAFINHIGIPAADIGFGGEASGGIYHSIYDDFYWYTHFGDPDFAYERAESQVMGTAVMRLADAEVLPFDFTGFAETVKKYISNVQELLETNQTEIKQRNTEIEDGVFSATSDPTKPVAPPPSAKVPPHFNFAPLQNALDELTDSAGKLSKAWNKAQADDWSLPATTIARVNQLMMQSGPALTDPAGLPHRPWFKNMIYAPGAYTGYEAKPLPGVLEAMDRKDWAEAESQIPREADALRREAKIIDEITAALGSQLLSRPSVNE